MEQSGQRMTQLRELADEAVEEWRRMKNHNQISCLPLSRMPYPGQPQTPHWKRRSAKLRRNLRRKKRKRMLRISLGQRKSGCTVPYIPTVTFNTPIPQRGGRGRGGSRVGRESSGRGSHAANGASGERPNHSSAATASTTGDIENRGRGGSNGPRAASLPPNSTKRPSSGTRDRKSPAAPNVDKSKTAQASASTKGESNSAGSSQVEQSVESHQNQQVAQGDNSWKSDQAPIPSEGNAKASTVDRKGEQTLRGSDQFKEGGNLGKDGQTRDRVDGRSDRGRGGFRGRGNHNNYLNGQNPQHPFTNGHGPQPPNGFIRQNSNSYTAAIPQPPFSNQYTQTPARGGRGGTRSLSIQNPAMYGRFPAGLPQMPPNPMFDYQHMQPMSATPYSPFSIDHASVLAMVTMQLEYYFSIDNLCKDVYLRKHMDSQGFVFLSFIVASSVSKLLPKILRCCDMPARNPELSILFKERIISIACAQTRDGRRGS